MAKNILFVLPFYKGDEGQAFELCRYIAELSGGNKIGKEALVVAAVGADGSRIVPELSKVFDLVNWVSMVEAPMLKPGEPSWPKGCNLQFLNVCEYVATRKDLDAFYFFEPDNLPLSPDWWDRICKEYSECGKPFMGSGHDHDLTDSAGNHLFGRHMNGTGIYPANVWMRLPILRELKRSEDMKLPWDALIGRHIRDQVHFSPLIESQHRCFGVRDDMTGLSSMGGGSPLLRKQQPITPQAAVFHGVKDASLLNILRNKHGLQPTKLTFLHSGDLGDIVYSLASIKALGGGILYLTDKRPAREALTPERMEAIIPLIKAQPYIEDVKIWDGRWVHYDFTGFRATYKQHRNIAECHADFVGANTDCINEPWIIVEPAENSPKYVVNRTARYRNPSFPWVAMPHNEAVFVGTNAEYDDFVRKTGAISRLKGDLLQVAQWIAGSSAFYGNQSVCYAIAEGLKRPSIQETFEDNKDCIFYRVSAEYWIDGKLVKGSELKPASPVVVIKEPTIEEDPIEQGESVESLVSKLKNLCSSPRATAEVHRALEAAGLRKDHRPLSRRKRKPNKNSLTVNA